MNCVKIVLTLGRPPIILTPPHRGRIEGIECIQKD